jgi:hypothetical protein
MSEETKTIVVPEELRHKMEVAELRAGKANAEFIAAQQGVTLAQQNVQASNQVIQAINERIAVEITDRGAWDVIHQNMETGEFTLKLSAVGKKRREDEVKAALEKLAELAKPGEAVLNGEQSYRRVGSDPTPDPAADPAAS